MEAGEPDARAPVFSPDGRWIAFLSTRARPEGWKQTPPAPPESDPATDVWLIPAARRPGRPARRAGEALRPGVQRRLLRPARVLPRRSTSSRSSPTTGSTRARAEEMRTTSSSSATTRARATPATAPPRSGSPHLDAKPDKQAATQDRAADEGRRVVRRPAWSPDGKTIVVHANRTADRESVRYSINRTSTCARSTSRRASPATDARRRGRRSRRGSPPTASRSPASACRGSGSHRDVFNLAVVSLDGEGPTVRVLFDHHKSRGKTRRTPRRCSRCPTTAGTVTRTWSTTPRWAPEHETVRVDLGDGQGRRAAPRRKKPAGGNGRDGWRSRRDGS